MFCNQRLVQSEMPRQSRGDQVIHHIRHDRFHWKPSLARQGMTPTRQHTRLVTTECGEFHSVLRTGVGPRIFTHHPIQLGCPPSIPPHHCHTIPQTLHCLAPPPPPPVRGPVLSAAGWRRRRRPGMRSHCWTGAPRSAPAGPRLWPGSSAVVRMTSATGCRPRPGC